jgi:hypothetical protein
MDSLYLSAGNKRTDHPAGLTVGSSYPLSLRGIGYWFRDNFDHDIELIGAPPWDNPAIFTNRRAMFTTDNPVSNQLPGSFGTITLTKASANNGSYFQLYTALKLMMTENNPDLNRPDCPYANHNPQPPGQAFAWANRVPLSEDQYGYAGMRFLQNPDADAVAGTPDTVQLPERYVETRDTNPMRMFRNVIRDTDATRIGASGASTFYSEQNNAMTTPVARPSVLQIPNAQAPRRHRSRQHGFDAQSERAWPGAAASRGGVPERSDPGELA